MPPVAPFEAPAEAAAPPAPRRPRAGRRMVALVAALLLAVGVSVYVASRPPAVPPPPRPAIDEPFNEVDLGVFSRPFTTDVPGLLKENFVLRVTLVLNPGYGDPARVRPLVERRRSQLRHVVNLEVIHARTEAELRRPEVLGDLLIDIRRRLNRALGGPRDGQDVILEVLFPEADVPPRR